jgi:hypothetical protein
MQFLETLTVGLPFCGFKIMTGDFYGQPWLVALGLIDAAINLANMIGIIFFKRRILNACFLSLVVNFFKRPTADAKMKWEDLGNSLDVLLSFILVAVMIAYGNLKLLPGPQLLCWNISVVLNVLGAGLGRLTASIKNLSP